jgi:hypothetical protein
MVESRRVDDDVDEDGCMTKADAQGADSANAKRALESFMIIMIRKMIEVWNRYTPNRMCSGLARV